MIMAFFAVFKGYAQNGGANGAKRAPVSPSVAPAATVGSKEKTDSTNQAPPKSRGHGAPGKENLLDFEGEVFEGEKKRPDLFLDIKIGDVKIDDLVFKRQDFNEYFEADKKFQSKFAK
jgi:hypothetical protein